MKKLLLIALFALCVPSDANAVSYTFTVNDNETVCKRVYTRKSDSAEATPSMYKFTTKASGTFGDGSLAFFTSYDGGSTLDAIQDETRVNVITTSYTRFNSEIGKPSIRDIEVNNGGMYICATMSGATNPDVTVEIKDNY